MIPNRPPGVSDGVEFGQTAEVTTPAEVIDDESLDAGGFGCIDHDVVQRNAWWSNGADYGVLIGECFGELIDRVGRFDDGQSVWKGGF